jgi:hypothetical protein
MALNKNTLKQNLIDNFTDIRNNVKSKEDSADGFAQAIVDYSSDAVLPAAANAPVTSAQLGLSTLKSGILASYEAQDATMGLVSTAIAAYVTTSLITFANSTVPPTNTGVATTIVMVTPPVFTPSMAVGMGGGSIEDVCDSLATVIDLAYGSILFTGIVVLGGAAGTVMTAMPIL